MGAAEVTTLPHALPMKDMRQNRQTVSCQSTPVSQADIIWPTPLRSSSLKACSVRLTVIN
jgi:hypothetical protein